MLKKSFDLRARFQSLPIVRIVGAHNALGAKLIEKNGFDGVWASGLEISTAHGVPDANILTMTDYLQAASSINEATALPVVCDCDTGYGNSANVWHMVKKYEAAGLAAAVIEDKLFPKVNSFVPGRQELATVEEFCGKIRSAKDAQKKPDFMVFARVEALIAGWGLDEALRRAEAYAQAGADGIVIHSKATTPEEIYEFARRWKRPIPLVAIPTTYYDVTADELAARGFKMVIYANQGIRASIRAMDETFATIRRTGSTEAVEKKISSMKEVFELQGMPGLKENEAKYLKKETIQAVLPAAGEHRARSGFAELLQEQPLCMVDIAGKTLLDLQCDTLRSCGVNEIYVVGGEHADQIRAEGIQVLRNADSGSGIAQSVLTAADSMKDKCLVAYSDILYDRRIVDQLLKSPYAITIVIDRAYRSLPPRDKKLDLVAAEDLVEAGHGRSLEVNTFKKVLKVSTALPKDQANYEFIGMAFFSGAGIGQLREAWHEVLAKPASAPFYEASGPRTADLNDLLQYLIDSGRPVHGMEIERGWSEIHSVEDLSRVRSYFTRSRQQVAAAGK